jgi:hypothetical protein
MRTRQHRYDPELPRLSLCGRAILPRPEQRWGVRRAVSAKSRHCSATSEIEAYPC